MDVTIIYINENYNINSMNGSKTGSLNTFVFPLKSFIIGIIRNTKRCNTTKIKPLEQYFCAISSNRIELELGDFSNPGRVLQLEDSDLINLETEIQTVNLPYNFLALRLDLDIDHNLTTYVYYDGFNLPYTVTQDPSRLKDIYITFESPVFIAEKTQIDLHTGDSEILETYQLDQSTFKVVHYRDRSLDLEIKLYQ